MWITTVASSSTKAQRDVITAIWITVAICAGLLGAVGGFLGLIVWFKNRPIRREQPENIEFPPQNGVEHVENQEERQPIIAESNIQNDDEILEIPNEFNENHMNLYVFYMLFNQTCCLFYFSL